MAYDAAAIYRADRPVCCCLVENQKYPRNFSAQPVDIAFHIDCVPTQKRAHCAVNYYPVLLRLYFDADFRVRTMCVALFLFFYAWHNSDVSGEQFLKRGNIHSISYVRHSAPIYGKPCEPCASPLLSVVSPRCRDCGYSSLAPIFAQAADNIVGAVTFVVGGQDRDRFPAQYNRAPPGQDRYSAAANTALAANFHKDDCNLVGYRMDLVID